MFVKAWAKSSILFQLRSCRGASAMYPVLKERIPVKREEDLFGLVEALGKQPLDGSWAADGAIVASQICSTQIKYLGDEKKLMFSLDNT